LEAEEDHAAGVLREAQEETGLQGFVLDGLLGVDEFDQAPYGVDEIQQRFFYHLRLEGEAPARFVYQEKFPSDGEALPITFEFWWAKLPEEVPWLMAGHGRFLPDLCRKLNLPVGELEYQAEFSTAWSEEDTVTFLAHGRYFIPERERQIEMIISLIPVLELPFQVLDLGCGEGLLDEALLEQYPQAEVHCYDGSWSMLRAARQRLQHFGPRVQLRHFELTAREWRRPDAGFQAILSSLAVHHLDGPGKQRLFRDLFEMLQPGGSLVLADLVQPVSDLANQLAAHAYDEEVLRRSLELDGDDRFYREFRKLNWNYFQHPDPVDHPSPIFDQLEWLRAAGFEAVDVYWLKAGHAIYGGRKPFPPG
jgi:tRNA (cmo5U34)-methyltransferase